jgi:alpha-glucosidase
VHDGEPSYVPARIDRRTPRGTWWRAELVAHNVVSHYRFLLDGGSTNYRWLCASGLVEGDVPDAGDFRVALAPEPPAWLDDAIVYQILPDRFARSGRVTEPLPDWALPAGWDDAPRPAGRSAARQLFGGDLRDGVVLRRAKEHGERVTVLLRRIWTAGRGSVVVGRLQK